MSQLDIHVNTLTPRELRFNNPDDLEQYLNTGYDTTEDSWAKMYTDAILALDYYLHIGHYIHINKLDDDIWPFMIREEHETAAHIVLDILRTMGYHRGCDISDEQYEKASTGDLYQALADSTAATMGNYISKEMAWIRRKELKNTPIVENDSNVN